MISRFGDTTLDFLLLSGAPETPRAAASRETPVHDAADAHVKVFTIAVMYAFLKARKVLKADVKNIAGAMKVLRAALNETLPRALLDCLIAGGQAASMPQVRAAGDYVGHEFHGNQWTAGGGRDTAQGVDTHTESAVKAITAKTGQPFEANLYRGVDPAEKDKFNRTPSQFAVGEYRSPFPEIAATYGSKVQTVRTRLENPYVMKLGEKDYQSHLKSEFGTRDPHEITQQLMAKGHDGLIVKNVPANRGEVSMRDSIEIIIFPKPRTLASPFKMRFDIKNIAAAAWARLHAAKLIDGISETTEENIREAVARAQEGGETLFDDILDAIGDEARAALIARTETMRAANEGQRQLWKQAVDKGLLTGEERREWIVAEEACDECNALDGAQADLDGIYPGDGGDGPPLHPNCRCTEGISVLRSAARNRSQEVKDEARDKSGRWTKGSGVTPATPGGSIPGHESPAIMSAIDLLPADIKENLPNIVVAIAVNENLARTTGKSVRQGWVRDDDPHTLYIASWSDTYKNAMKGDRESLIQLAASIAHEQYHTVHGQSEAEAYDQQIAVLTKLGASKTVIDGVRKAKEYVVGKGL